MLPTEDLFVYVYVLVDDALGTGAIAVPPRPGPAPACSDAELLTIALVRHLLGRRSEAGFLDEVARDWAHLFPRLPHQSEANRRIRWLWGAFEHFRAALAARLPEDGCQQVDTSALPVKHPSRVRGPDQWTGPGNDLAARAAVATGEAAVTVGAVGQGIVAGDLVNTASRIQGAAALFSTGMAGCGSPRG